MTEPIDVKQLVELQASIWLPVLRTLRARLGPDAAAELVEAALREWRREEALRLFHAIPGRGACRWLNGQRSLGPRLAGAVEYQVLEQSSGHVAFEVTRCDIARYFVGLGEPALGFGLWCALDATVAELIGEGEVELTRRGTLMEGAACCDFRYTFADDGFQPRDEPGAGPMGAVGPSSENLPEP
jgi:hypothetical protein